MERRDNYWLSCELMFFLCRHCNLHRRGRGSKGELSGLRGSWAIGGYQPAEDDLHMGYQALPLGYTRSLISQSMKQVSAP
jgi:hypothetical protein